MALAFPALTLPGQTKTTFFLAPRLHGPKHRKYTVKIKSRSLPKLRVATVRATSEESVDAATASRSFEEVLEPSSQAIFGGEKRLTGFEKLLEGLSAPARYGACAAIVAGALAAGYVVGSTRKAAVGGAVALGVAGGITAYALNSTAPRIAAVNLHNKVASCEHPSALNKEDIDSIVNKYGVSKQDEAFNAELRDLYDRYVSSVIPPGNEELKGDEAEKITKFKNALGIDDPDAAAVHIEIGRRMFRQRLETGDREAVTEERRTFQKLVYVSNLIFGDASKFLLPWKRVFKVTDAQIEVAIRDNAQRLFKSRLSLLGRDLQESQLTNLREEQLRIKLPDEAAAEMIRDYTRRQIEENISTALEIIKSQGRVRGSSIKVVEELDKILLYNQTLTALSQHPDKEKFPAGIGPVSMMGGEYDSDRKIDDLKQLYRVYLTEAFSSGRIEDEKVAAMNKLKNIFGFGNREAEQITLEVTTKVYRRRLSQAVKEGDLEAAPSKATFLQNLCDELHFDAQKANEVHEEIYRQKLQQCIADGILSEEDAASLLRLRVLLCIPQQTIDAAHTEICGRIFEKIVDEAISRGVEGYDTFQRAAVQKAARGLRLTKDIAMSIASKAVRKVCMIYLKRAKAAGDPTESAKELKKLIIFNKIAITKLVADVKGESPVVSSDEESRMKELDESEIRTLRQEKAAKRIEDNLDGQAQTEITLTDDLTLSERIDLYRTYLLYCITGEGVRMPMGNKMTVRTDPSEFLRLEELRGILGLTSKEVADVRNSLAEQAFRKQAEVILADGQLSKARIEQLNELQKQVGIPSELAQKIIKRITATKIGGAIESALSQGKITIEQIRELRAANVDLDNMISKGAREHLLKKTIDGIFSSGTGEFNEEEVYERLPADLGMDASKAKKVVQNRAKERLSNSLLQAVALLRQRNTSGVVSSLNDLLACDKAVPSEPLSWSMKEELADLYCIYLKSNPNEEKVSRLQYLLGIDESTASSLQESVKAGTVTLGAEEEEEEFVF